MVACIFTYLYRSKYFCKEDCEGGIILVHTQRAKEQRGRYSIEHIPGPSTHQTLFVSISQLTQSDSGRYICVLGEYYLYFDIVVTDGEFPPELSDF